MRRPSPRPSHASGRGEQTGDGKQALSTFICPGLPTPACVLPLPLAGEGWGEGRSVNEVKGVAIATAGPLPRPSPASGRGEKTGSVSNLSARSLASGFSNSHLRTPSPACGRGLG
ncbi:hypothetical protein CBM2589_A20174 [Cupriavidus taiwanensis]|uniref:Uncharacterized protein n=1 Tax=Cupriavidus taiwanensis TaxID=164546 RepID=A0A975X6D5_9BURK|nr:hypothetical protein CBM2589_A20174 [Cupriavidus taiwanensis]